MISRSRVAGLDIEFADEGPPDARHTIVLLHGFTGNKDSWADLRSRSEADYRVVSVDLPGFGGSACASTLADAGMVNLSMMLGELSETLELRRPVLVGYSMGGRVALHYALTSPDRVRALVLIGASPGLATEEERRERRCADEELAGFIETHSIEEFVARWEAQPLFESQKSLPSVVRGRIRDHRLGCSRQGLAMALRALGSGVQPWLGDRLSELELPVLLIAGQRDHKFVDLAERMQSGMRRARVLVASGVGHSVQLEAPHWLHAALCDFIGHLQDGTAEEFGRACP